MHKENKNKEVMTGMSIREAIDRYGCERKNCPFLDKNGWFFCRAIRTDDFCLRKVNNDGKGN